MGLISVEMTLYLALASARSTITVIAIGSVQDHSNISDIIWVMFNFGSKNPNYIIILSLLNVNDFFNPIKDATVRYFFVKFGALSNAKLKN